METPPLYPEERRLATVLFADIQGFTALAEQLDFEEVTDLIKEVWLQVDTAIEAHGGYIDKHIGDAVMAVWGAPHAREDDAERAVAAGLALQVTLADYTAHTPLDVARTLQMRVGLNTGPVLASYVGLRGEYTVMGDTVNVASRLEHLAEPGTIVISESTYRLVRGAFRIRHLSPAVVKGKTGALQPFVVEGALSQPGRARYHSAGGLETCMVAREAELARLVDLYHQSRQASTLTLVAVRGEAGLGKSRLLLEFIRHLEADEPALVVLAARGLAQASRVPFFLWKSLWQSRFGLSEDEPPETAREKLLRGVQGQWGRQLGPASAVETAHLLGGLIGLDWPDSPYLAALPENPARAQRAFDLTGELLSRISRAAPTILLFDDLHWADASSLELLAYLLTPGRRPLPLFILAGVRPGFLRHHSVLAEAAEVIGLAPLPMNAAVVAAAYPSLRSLSTPTLEVLARRTDGNPYFLEELVKSRGLSKLASDRYNPLPDSLQTLLQARLDDLSPEARNVALLAAVVGRVFWLGAIRATLRESTATGPLHSAPGESETLIAKGLIELMYAELAFPRAGSAFVNDKEYIFKHSLLRDVAYGLLPHKHRRPYHLAVARWLAASAGPDFAATVAEHLEQAGAYSKAVQYYEQAIRYAQSRGADGEAAWLQARAGELGAKLPESGSVQGA